MGVNEDNRSPQRDEAVRDGRMRQRAHRRRKAGVKYRLRVIPGSDGLLELVEVHEPNPFLEWARLMQLSGWHS